MKRKDQGLMHYTFSMILISWAVLMIFLLLLLLRAERLKAYLQDCMTQAGLSALLIEPYTYGMSGEVIFADVQEVEQIYLKYLETALGSSENQEKLGIAGEVVLTQLIVYEKTTDGIRMNERQEDGSWLSAVYAASETVCAPDGTQIVSAAIYAAVRVPVLVWGEVTVEIERQHCVDIV